MKIDYRGTFESLAGVIQHRPRPVASSTEFSRLLGDMPTPAPAQQPPIEKIDLDNTQLSVTLRSVKEKEQQTLRQPAPTPLSFSTTEKISTPSVSDSINRSSPEKIDSNASVIADASNQVSTSVHQSKQHEPVATMMNSVIEKATSSVSAKVMPVKYEPIADIERILSTPQTLSGAKAMLNFSKIASPARNTVGEVVAKAGQKHGVDPALGLAVAQQESGLNHKAISADGHASKGLFQLLDSTGKDLMARQGYDAETYDPFNPELNVDLGMGYLRYLHDIFASPVSLTKTRKTFKADTAESLEKFAVAAFNAGEGRVASAQARALKAGKDPSDFSQVLEYLPKSTQQYVSRVLSQRDTMLG